MQESSGPELHNLGCFENSKNYYFHDIERKLYVNQGLQPEAFMVVTCHHVITYTKLHRHVDLGREGKAIK